MIVGPVSLGLIGTCGGTIVLTRKSEDRLVPVFAWYLALSMAASMLVHWTQHGTDPRSTVLMWMDCGGLYLLGMTAVCRWARTPWLCGLIAATALECGAHLLYARGLIGGDQHTLALHLLFLAQAASLLALRAPIVEEVAAA